VGAGLLPYIPFLLRTTALGRPLLAVEYKHLSMRWTDHIPTAPEVCNGNDNVIFLCKFMGCSLFGVCLQASI
jgi:hypothetical protein